MSTNIKVSTLLNSFRRNSQVILLIDGQTSLSADIAYCKALMKKGDVRFDRRIKALDMQILGVCSPSATLSIYT